MMKHAKYVVTFAIVLALIFTLLPFGMTNAYADGTCTVTFDSQGGSEVPKVVVDYNTAIRYENADEPDREGYFFDGWYTDPECTINFDLDSDLVTHDMTLYAAWAAIQHIDNGLYQGFFYVHDWWYDGYRIVGYDGDATDIVIPGYIGNSDVQTNRVYELSPGALSHTGGGRDGLAEGHTITSVTFPHLTADQLNNPSHPEWSPMGISLNWGCLQEIESLTSVDLSNSGDVGPPEAFMGDINLETITCSSDSPFSTMQDGVLFSSDMKTLKEYSPAKSGTTYTIPDGVETVRATAFTSSQNLQTISVPASVLDIGERAFGLGRNLTSINVAASNPNFISEDGVLFDKSKSAIYAYPGAKEGPYIIPNTVTTLKFSAFEEVSGLTSITIPASLSVIEHLHGDPNGPIQNPFGGCDNLSQIIIEAGSPLLAEQGGVIFNPEITTLIAYPAGRAPDEDSMSLMSMNRNMVKIRKLESLREGNYTVPDTVDTIVAYAFSGTNLATVTIPRSVINIDNDAFFLAEGITICGHRYSAAQRFADDNGIPFVDLDPPSDFQLEVSGTEATIIGYTGEGGDITIPDELDGFTILGIGDNAFIDCKSLTGISIPSSITSIGDSAFVGCTNLAQITVNPSNTAYCSEGGILYDSDESDLLCYPACKTGAAFTIPDSVHSISNGAFSSNEMLTSVTISQNVTSIGMSIFDACHSLAQITVVPANTSFASLDGILYNADKSDLICYPAGKAGASFTIPDSVNNIGIGAFSSNENLTSITISQYVTSIGTSAFNSCTNMAQITVDPANTTYSSLDGVLYDADKSDIVIYPVANPIEHYSIPGTVTSLDAWSLAGKRMESVNIPASVTLIEPSALSFDLSLLTITVDEANTHYASQDGVLFGNTAKTSILQFPGGITGNYTIPDRVTNIMDFAFCGISLTDVTIPTNVTIMGDHAFAWNSTLNLSRAIFLGEVFNPNPDFKISNAFDGEQDGFKMYYHVSHVDTWSHYTDYPLQAFCMLTLDAQNGSAPQTDITPVNNGKLTAPTSPTRTGYVFGGWYREAACTNAWNFNATVTTDITLYAKWFPTVTFNSQGGSAIADTTATASTITQPTSPSKAGYIFDGWYKEPGCIHAWNFTSDTVTTPITLYAKWVAVVAVSISCQKTDATTYGGTDGTITITPSGGNSGLYQFSINGGANWQSSGYFNSLSAGTYSVIVRDATNTGNTTVASIMIGQPAFAGSFPANKTPKKENAGSAITITPPAPPTNFIIQSITYASSDNSIATVDSNGNITFLKGGKVTITITVISMKVDSKGNVTTKTKITTKTITVNQPVASITLNQADATIARTKTVKLIPTFTPTSASNQKVKWTSSNARVATVSAAGVATGKAGGTAIITCTTQDGSNVSASCTVTVTPIYPTGVKMSKTNLQIIKGKTGTLKATVLPANTDFKTVTWASSTTSIATVDGKGKITAVSQGTATITATTSNGLGASCIVIIK